jgi:hypothetical protein
MAVELVQDAAGAIELYPDTSRPASATGAFYNPAGTLEESPTVTVDTIGDGGTATISSVTSQTVLVVDVATKIVPGRWYWLDSTTGWSAPVLVSKIAGTTITLEAPPPGTVATSDTLRGLRCTATIAAASLDDRDMNYRMEWTVTGADGAARKYQTIVHCVRMQFRDPCTAEDAARYVSFSFPGYAASVDAGHWVEVAKRASNRVRRMLRASGNYPHLVGEQEDFMDAGLCALRAELAMNDGLTPPGHDPSVYVEDQERALTTVVQEALASQWIDRDDDGAEGPDDVRGMYVIRAVRT